MTAGLVAVPKSIPEVLQALGRLELDIEKAETYESLRKVERTAEALGALYGEVDQVRIEAGRIIVFANHRIGEELTRLPNAKPSGSNQHKKQDRHPERADPTLKEQVGSKNRGLRLKKLAAHPKEVVKGTVQTLANNGKDVTVSAVLKQLAEPKEPKERKSPLKVLALAWSKASAKERREFLQEIGTANIVSSVTTAAFFFGLSVEQKAAFRQLASQK